MGIFRTNNPTEFDDIDGIIIDEQAPPPAISGVSANTAILVGQFERGPDSLSLPISSTREFQEVYGNDRSKSGNKQLANKRFGRLKIIRALASDAALATLTVDTKIRFDAKNKGVYGNSISVTVEDASTDVAAVAQVEDITARADSSDDLDGEGIILQDDAGSVAFWIDVDNSGTTIPAWASAADRAVEVTGVVTDDTDIAVAIAMAATINGDSKFSAPVPTTAVFTVTHSPAGARSAGGANGQPATAFSFATTTAGADAVEGGSKYTIKDNNSSSVLPDEIFDNIKIADITASTFQGSKLVDVTVLSTASEVANTAETNLASGSDGTIADTDYQSAIAKAEQERAGNVLFLDEYNTTRNGYLKTHAATTQDKMVICCGDSGDDRAAIIAKAPGLRDSDGRIILAWPYVQTTIQGGQELTPPASWVASVFSQTAPNVELSFTGNTSFLAGITDLASKEGRNGYISLNEAGVMALEQDLDIGFVIKNSVTTQIIDTSKIPVIRRRMADFLTDSIALFLKNFQNAVNSKAKRDEVQGAILEFDARLVRDQILPGSQDVVGGEPLLVDTESLNTDDIVAQGQFRILYKRRIFSSMRFIVLQAEIGTSVVVTEV